MATYDSVPTSAEGLRAWIDTRVMKFAADQLKAMIESELIETADDSLVRTKRGFRLRRAALELATITATETVVGHRMIHANFMQEGPQWTELKTRIESRTKREREKLGRSDKRERETVEKSEEISKRKAANFRLRAADFLSAAGIDKEIDFTDMPDNGKAFRKWLDRHVMLLASHRLRAMIESKLEAEGSPQGSLKESDRGFELIEPGRLLVNISPTHAKVGGHHIDANFLLAGPHWTQVIKRSRPVEKRPTERIYRKFPDDLQSDLREAGLTASCRLRNERNLVFDHRVEIEVSTGDKLVFQPIRGSMDGPEVPFQLITDNSSTECALQLRGADNPMPLVIRRGHGDGCPGSAWVLALCAYAELTIVAPPIRRNRPAAHNVASVRGTRRPPRRQLPRGRVVRYSSKLLPSRGTTAFLSSYVAGHRRRLRPDHSRSAEAAAAAAAAGIELLDDETWVRPFSRGNPPDGGLTFKLDIDSVLPRRAQRGE